MFVLTGIIEDTQFNAVRKETGWEVNQWDPHTGKQLTTVVTDEEFGATLALLVAGDELSCTDVLYSHAAGMVQKQHEALHEDNMTTSDAEQAAYPFRMIP